MIKNSLTRTKTILVTGASSGLGKACAQLLASRGHTVYGTSRKGIFNSSVSEQSPEIIPMDVCDDTSVKEAVNYVIEKSGSIDVVINNAGIVYSGSIEDMSIDECRSQLETNFFGAVRVTKSVLPHMRQQGHGLFINISSIGGFVGLPFQAAYSASKFALEGFTESLRIEVAPYGIRALIIQPGDFQTAITSNRVTCKNNTEESAYFEASRRATDTTIAGELNGAAPEVLAKKIESLLEKQSPRVRYTTGPFLQCLAARLKYWMPSRFFERLIADEYK